MWTLILVLLHCWLKRHLKQIPRFVRVCGCLMQALLEEFGKWIKPGTSADQAERDSFYQAAYQEVLNVRIYLPNTKACCQQSSISQ